MSSLYVIDQALLTPARFHVLYLDAFYEFLKMGSIKQYYKRDSPQGQEALLCVLLKIMIFHRLQAAPNRSLMSTKTTRPVLFALMSPLFH